MKNEHKYSLLILHAELHLILHKTHLQLRRQWTLILNTSLGILENRFIFCSENNVYAAYWYCLDTEYSLYMARGYCLVVPWLIWADVAQ